jgi:hypothetical protein
VSALWAENVIARKYFWPGCHKMEPYRSLYPHAGLLLPVTQRVAERVLLLPTGTTVSAEAVKTICGIVRMAIDQRIDVLLADLRSGVRRSDEHERLDGTGIPGVAHKLAVSSASS